MAEVLASPTPSRLERREKLRAKRRRADGFIGLTALIAAMLALPLAQNRFHGPEVAATLAVAATAMLAGQRWAIALVVLAEMLLVPTLVPRAALDGTAFAQITGWVALAAMLPGLIAMKRGAAAMVLITGWRRTRHAVRRAHVGLVMSAALAALVPFL